MYSCCCVFLLLSIISRILGQEYTATPFSMSKCPVAGKDEIDYDVSLKDESDGSKSFGISTNLNLVLGEQCTYKTNVDILSGSKYVHYMQAEGNVCEGLGKLIKPAWEKFKMAMSPAIKESCTINPGSYSLSGFQVKKDDVNVPIPTQGQFRTDIHLFCDNMELACLLVEVMITEDE